MTYAFLNHVPSLVKIAILKSCVQSIQFFTYANELVLAITLLEKLENLEYSVLKFPNSPFYYSSIKRSSALVDSILHRTTNKEALAYDCYSSIELRFCLIMKCLADKTVMDSKKNYHPSLLIYSLIDEERLKAMKETFLKYKEYDKNLELLYKQAEDVRPKSKELYKTYLYLSLKSEEIKKKLKETKEKPEHRIISMIVNGEIDEAVTELNDFNIDFSESIDNQMDDLSHYSYFLCSIFRMFGCLSYFEIVSFTSKVKRTYKCQSKKELKKKLAQGMNIINSIKRSINFSGDGMQFLPDEIYKENDPKMVQILLLGFLQDYESLIDLFYEKGCNREYIQQIYLIICSHYLNLKSESNDKSNKYKMNYMKKIVKKLRYFIFDIKTINILWSICRSYKDKHFYCLNKNTSIPLNLCSNNIIATIKNTIHSVASFIIKFNDVHGESIFFKLFNLK